MKRRAFIAGLGGMAAWPTVARAQQSQKIPRIGVLWGAARPVMGEPYFDALRQGFRDLVDRI